MGSVLKVALDDTSGHWLVSEGVETLASYMRFREARAFARATLLERGEGSADVYTPSGRLRETLNVQSKDGDRVVQAA